MGQNALNNLINSGQLKDPSDLGGKLLLGAQLGQQKQQQQLANNLSNERLDMQRQTFARQTAQDEHAAALREQGMALAETLIGGFSVETDADQQMKDTLIAQVGSGDYQGAINNSFRIAEAEANQKGQTILDKQVNDNGDLTFVFGDAQGNPTGQHTINGIGKTKTQPQNNSPFMQGNFGDNSFSMGYGTPPTQGQAGQPAPESQGMTPNLLNTVVPPKTTSDGGAIMAEAGTGDLVWGNVPGSPADIKRIEADKAFEAKRQGAKDSAIAAISILDRVKDQVNSWNTGGLSAVIGKLDFFDISERAELESLLEPVKSKLALAAMDLAREGSSTGATGFGALSEKELALLQSTVNALNPNHPEQFWDGLNEVIYRFERIVGAANEQEIGDWDPSAYLDKPNREEYNRNKLNTAATATNPLAPSSAPSVPRATQAGEVIIEINDETGQKRMSYDDGKTWEYE